MCGIFGFAGNAMAHSLEVRLPFLDHRLIEQAFQIPPRLKNNGFHDKIIERRLARKLLPPVITNRKKIPFFLPWNFFSITLQSAL